MAKRPTPRPSRIPDTGSYDFVDSTGHTWTATCEYAKVNGRMEPVRFELKPKDFEDVITRDPDSLRPINAAVLREVPIGKVIAWLRQFYAELAVASAQNGGDGAAVMRGLAESYNRPRTKPLDVDELEQVASIYRTAWEYGTPPVVAVAEALHLPRSTAAKRVMRARKAGLLPPTTERRQRA